MALLSSLSQSTMSQSIDTKKQKSWLKAKVITGNKLGRQIGYPTLNLDNPNLLNDQPEGVYGCLVKIDKQIYKGLLYYGPRLILQETKKILEIFVFDFDLNIYGKVIYFQMLDYIRPVIKFVSINSLKKQLDSDCRIASKILLK